jgi:hypothetical protein
LSGPIDARRAEAQHGLDQRVDIGASARWFAIATRRQPADRIDDPVDAPATGVFRLREVARRMHEDLAFRLLAAGKLPRQRTICDFRASRLRELSALFVRVARLGTLTIDGTQVKASASRHEVTGCERRKQAEGLHKTQIAALRARAEATGEAEVDEPGLGPPAESPRREARLAAIPEAGQRLKQRQCEAGLARGRRDDDDCRPRGPDGRLRRRRALRGRECRVPAGVPRRGRTVRRPEGRIQRCDTHASRQVRAGPWRDTVPRRIRRHAAGARIDVQPPQPF